MLNPASVSGLEYIGRPMEISQSDTEVISPGETGFRQISVSPPLGIWAEEKKKEKALTLNILLVLLHVIFCSSSKPVEFNSRCYSFSLSQDACWYESGLRAERLRSPRRRRNSNNFGNVDAVGSIQLLGQLSCTILN